MACQSAGADTERPDQRSSKLNSSVSGCQGAVRLGVGVIILLRLRRSSAECLIEVAFGVTDFVGRRRVLECTLIPAGGRLLRSVREFCTS